MKSLSSELSHSFPLGFIFPEGVRVCIVCDGQTVTIQINDRDTKVYYFDAPVNSMILR